MGHVLDHVQDHVLDHIIIGFVSTALQILILFNIFMPDHEINKNKNRNNKVIDSYYLSKKNLFNKNL